MIVRAPSLGRHSLFWALLAAVEIGVIFWGSSRPSPVFTSSELIDTLVRKSGHIAEFALLGALAWLAVRAWLRPTAAVRTALVLATGYAIFDELHQVFTLTRRPSPVDVAIDAAGAAVGILAVRWFVRRGARRGVGRSVRSGAGRGVRQGPRRR